MRNLKKVLALVLALVMAMSLVTIANAADFSDNADIDYSEAVDVMVAAGIIDGVGNNSFDPNGTLTREQAAKLITYMLMGENSDKLGVEGTSFNDVAATRWSAPAIEYCAAMGIIDGAGDGNFYPAGKLTGYAFAKMLLTALGYDSKIEGFTGSSWTINVATVAMEAVLDDGLETMFGSAEISRQEAAQMALNAIKTPLVEYDNDSTISVNGATVQINGGSAKFVTTTLAKEQRISNRTLTNTGANTQNSGYTVEFGERYLPKLELKGETDAFGRPSYTWSYDKEEIGTYVDYTNLTATYTEEVTGKELYDVLGKSIVDDIDSSASDRYRLFVYIDGEDSASVNDAIFGVSNKGISKNNKDGVGATGNGVLTQVFIDADSRVVTIAIINTYLARAKDDYSEKKDEVTFNVYAIDKDKNDNYVKVPDNRDNSDDDSKALTVSGEDFYIADVKEDDAYLVTVAEGAIQTLAAAEVVGDVTLTAFKKNSNVVADGTTYNYAHAAEYDFKVLDEYTGGKVNLKEKSYNLYLDQYGYLIGVDLVTAADNYVFITGIDADQSNLAASNRKANAIFLDGKMEPIVFNVTKSSAGLTANALMNSWCTYTVDKDGIYSLTLVAGAIDTDKGVKVAQKQDTNTLNIDQKHVSLEGAASGNSYYKVYGNNDSVYLTVEVKTINSNDNGHVAIINKVSSVTTGVKNASLEVLNDNNPTNPTVTEQAAKDAGDKNAKITAAGDKATAAAWGTYVLYKSNGYVIAAVSVADDSASSKNLVYVTSSSVDQESYNSDTDEWTWIREVAIGGEKSEIKEVSDKLTHLGNGASDGDMQQYNWYEVKYNAKGEVVGAELATTALGHTTSGAGDEYVDDVTLIQKAIDDEENVLFENSEYNETGVTSTAINGDAKGPSLKGNTFFVRTTDTTGFFVDDSVKVVFIQKNDNKWTTSYEDGVKELEAAVGELNVNDAEEYNYEVSAILKGGAAQVVVIRDLNKTGKDGETPKPPVGDVGDVYVDLRDKAQVLINTTNATLNDDDAAEAMVKAVEDAGFTVENAEFVSDGGANDGKLVVAAKKGSIKSNFIWDPSGSDKGVSGVKFTIDGVTKITNSNSTGDVDEEIGWGGSASGDEFVRRSTDEGKTWTYALANATGTSITSGMEIETGYLKVTVNGSAVTDAELDMKKSGIVTDGTATYALATATA